MVTAARRWLAGHPRRAVRVAFTLWLIFAVVVWNVVFDRIVVLAGRRYVHAAAIAARGSGPYLLVDEWMRPAVGRAVRAASVAAGGILVLGFVALSLATRRSVTSSTSDSISRPS